MWMGNFLKDFFQIYFMYLKDGKAMKERLRERLAMLWFTSQMMTATRTDQVKARNQEFHTSPPHEWEEPNYLSHDPPSPRAHIQVAGSESEFHICVCFT